VLQLGSLSPRRDLTYVTDTVDGFVRAARADSVIGRTIQLGTGRDVSIGELAHLAMRVVGRAVRIETDDQRLRPASSELDRLLSKPQLAADLLGWKPQVELEEGIRLTADWLQMNISAFRPERYEV
jgi:nucleoside-diphosphate-sugar epimerase